jgi:alpha-tubulin suppressor-like RCC1 family protein
MGNVEDQIILTFNTSNVTAAGTTRNGMMYLKNGNLYYSGNNQYGELGTTSPITSTLNNNLSNITQFSAGLDHSLFVDNTNKVFASGLNTYGQLGIGTILNSSTPSLLNVSGIQVATGSEHSAILAPNGDTYTFGRNNYGQLGNNTQINSSIPVLVKSNVTAIACGSNHTLFLSQDNVYACGINTSGQLGTTSTTPWIPTLIPILSNVVSISSGGDNSAALDRVGNLWVWGDDYGSIPTILKTQVTYVNVTQMGLFYVSDKKYYALNTLFIPDGVITYNNTPLFRIISNICFPADTPVTTDQGDISIVDIQPNHHTIRGKRIVAITETYSSEKELIVIEKDALLPNCPSQRTLMTKEHKIFYNGQFIESYKFLNHEGVSTIPYEQQPLYNVLLEDPGRMKVNNMIVETLDPTNMIGKLFKEYQESLTN